MGNACFPPPSSEENYAFVFIKPHAQTRFVRDLVKTKLAASNINILKEGEISAKDIDDKKLIDQHYYAIASKATLLTPDKLPVPADQFKEKFGEEWNDVLAAGKAVNALQACKDFGIDASKLEEEWRKCESAGTVIKFGGGFYCGRMEVGGMTRYVFNAFFMNMRSKFVAPGRSIYYFVVSWSPADCSWAQFRGSVLGPTDPASAPVGSIRRTIFDDWKALGLSSEPNKGDNGVHASASPFEGLAERMNWLGLAIEDDPFGRALVSDGMSDGRIKAWALDPQVTQEDGSKGSVFDCLEDLDVEDCLKKLKARVEAAWAEMEKSPAKWNSYKEQEEKLALQVQELQEAERKRKQEAEESARREEERQAQEEEEVYMGKLLKIQAMARMILAKRRVKLQMAHGVIMKGPQPLRGAVRLRLERCGAGDK